MIFAAFCHNFGLGPCVVPNCEKRYHKHLSFEISSTVATLGRALFASIPIIGGAVILFTYRKEFFQVKEPFCVLLDTFCIVRYVLSMLGVGVIFLLLDIIFILGSVIGKVFYRYKRDEI